MRILMIEDEKYLAEPIIQVLKKNNYSVDLKCDGEEGLYFALSGIYDIIILDIMLPKLDGISVLKEIRKNSIETPVILLTARSNIEDKITGLDSGADDYLAKPFNTDELLARLRALGRRKSSLTTDGMLKYGDLKFNPLNLTIQCDNSEVLLTPKESQILELLMSRSNIIISKGIIIDKLWGYDAEAEDNHLQIHVSLLRKKIKRIKSHVTISAIRGAGYMLKWSEGDS